MVLYENYLSEEHYVVEGFLKVFWSHTETAEAAS
jgi:hypothetical protein